MNKCFKSLAEASQIIGEITEKATVQIREYVHIEGETVIEKISSYLSEFFKPLYDCKALNNHCLAKSDCVSIVKTNDYCGNQIFVLGLNIPLGGYRTYLKIKFYKDKPVVVEGDINSMTLQVLIDNWTRLKEQMFNHCESAINYYNRNCKLQVESYVELQNKIKNFSV